MKFNLLSTVLLSLLLVPLSLAAPTYVNGVESVGAAYTMTNQPSGNYLVVFSIGKDGKVAFSHVLPTEGVGAQGIDAPIGDSEFSQGSIQVHYGKHLLVNSNLGSSTLTLWRVDPENPINVSMIGKPVASGGNFPNSVTFNSAGDRLCASNTGTKNGLMCFFVDTVKGLIPIKNTFRPYGILEQTVPATGPMNSASHLKFSDDDKQLHLSAKGYDAFKTRGFVATWDVDLCNDNPSVSQNNSRIYTDQIGLRPFGMTYINGRNAIVTADPFIGMDIFDLDKGTALAVPLPNNGAHCWVMYNKKTDRYYVIDANGSTVTEAFIDISQDVIRGAVTKRYPKMANSYLADPDMVEIGDKQYLMYLGPGQLVLYVDEIRAAGDIRPVQVFNLNTVHDRAGVPIDKYHTNGFITYLNSLYAPK
ncbi:hypothetical protein APHAL10511_007718 [Amanita phalloides]|nr:hypothetical protein APHAL10511_007718 [Amanita phalloides]